MWLPKAQVEKLMSESRDGAKAAARIMQLCAGNSGDVAWPRRSAEYCVRQSGARGSCPRQTGSRRVRPDAGAQPPVHGDARGGTGFMMVQAPGRRRGRRRGRPRCLSRRSTWTSGQPEGGFLLKWMAAVTTWPYKRRSNAWSKSS